MIPYPLSTGLDCGDPMYSRFKCNNLTGQVSFVGLNLMYTFRVISISPSTQRFFLQRSQAKVLDNCDHKNRDIIQQFNATLPFEIISWCNADLGNFNVVELGWELPPEPNCNTSADCRGWPNSTCNPTEDGRKRCLCNKSFQWNASNFNCTQGECYVLVLGIILL